MSEKTDKNQLISILISTLGIIVLGLSTWALTEVIQLNSKVISIQTQIDDQQKVFQARKDFYDNWRQEVTSGLKDLDSRVDDLEKNR